LKNPKWIAPLFIIAALYDGILGLIGIFAPAYLYNMFGVALPNHMGYVQFPALILITFAIMFYNIAKDIQANKNLIFYGILLKASYCLVIFGHWSFDFIPFMWKPFAIFDLIFLIGFVFADRSIK
jgi:hypothetical protein